MKTNSRESKPAATTFRSIRPLAMALVLSQFLATTAFPAEPNPPPPPGLLQKCPPVPDWIKKETSRAKPLVQKRLLTIFPARTNYANYITLTRNQDGWGGCFMMAALYVVDALKEMEHPYTPDLSYRYAQYYYDECKVQQNTVHINYGACAEGRLHTDYDPLAWTGSQENTSLLARPTRQDDSEAKFYRLASISGPIVPTVSGLRTLLLKYGPLWAAGTISGVGHCFAIVGYDDDISAFQFINSWGDTWNGNGFGVIPYDKLTTMVDHVNYFVNRPFDRSGTPDAYTARIRIHHQNLRNELTVAVGVEGMAPEVVYARPDRTNRVDTSQNLCLDVPLPAYARYYWPPSQAHRWFVQVTDGDQNGKSAVVEEVTLAQLARQGNGKFVTIVHRSSMRQIAIPDSQTRKIFVPTLHQTQLNLSPTPSVVSPSQPVALKGFLYISSQVTDGAPTLSALRGKKVRIQSVLPSSDSIEQSQYDQVSDVTTDSGGEFSLSVSPEKTTTYVAVFTQEDGQIVARSHPIKVTVQAN